MSFPSFLHEVAEVVGREETLLGEIFHRRQPFLQGPVVFEVVVEQPFKLVEHIEIGRLAGDELPLVETHTIVEQQFDVAADEFLGVLVDGVLQLLPYLVQTILEDVFLVFAQVEGLREV